MNYEKIAIISLLLLVCPLIRAIEYTVDKVPNVHLDDGRRFVSNPDGILSAETVNTLDQMLFSYKKPTLPKLQSSPYSPLGTTT